MKIPKIYKRQSIGDYKNDILTIDLDEKQLEPVVYFPDVDMEDPKSVDKYTRELKSMIRQSREYKVLMKFLKEHRDMSRCFFLPNVKHYRGDKITIEAHHTGFVMTDIIKTVLRKRVICEEDYSPQSIAKEVMLCHYKGMISITSLSSTIHELIHEDDSSLFIPLQMADFGNMNLFYAEYKEFMDKELIKKFEQYKLLSEAVVNIEDIIPEYLDVKYVYYKAEGVEIPDMQKILEIVQSE